jgi:7-keto-8-aminopelargonate synthetase-like enzyme
MSTKSNTTQIILDIIQEGVSKGILHLNTDGEKISNNKISINKKEVVSFSSCSYLGLEHHHLLKEGAKAAIDAYGTQFSSSRAYLSLGLYENLETLLGKIFQDNKVIVSPTTTLGHIAAIPVLVEDGDAVLLDHQVHHSVQTAAGLLRSKNIHIEMVRHNDMTRIEEKIIELKKTHKKIWYLADGIYSMYGDFCKLNELTALLNKYEQFWAYVDDAHGMSYFGKHGSGYVCSQISIHPQMVLATSLNKAFASGGGALIFTDSELHKKVRTCGSPLITSGPLQPASLGAGIAAAHLHLSAEIYDLQSNLHDKIQFTKDLLLNYGLPLISESGAAIFFVGVSVPKLGYRIVKKMLDRGFLVNLGIFPAVPIKNTGIRFTITALHTYKQINDMAAALKEEFEKALIEENISIEQIFKAFKKDMPDIAKAKMLAASVIIQSLHLKTESYNSILDVKKENWDNLFLGRGAFDWNALALLENVFSENEKPEDNWDFNYIIVSDNNNNPVAATFITTALWKDDMLSPADVSAKIEELRKESPYYLISKVTSAGSLITEGEHIYIDRNNPLWKEALINLLDKINEVHQQTKSNSVVLRDFAKADAELISVITGNGYFKNSMPDAHLAENISWTSQESFFETLSRKNKMHFRTDVRRFYNDFEFVQVKNPAKEVISNWYNMYNQVRERNLDINAFPLPLKFFEQVSTAPEWDVTVLTLKETGETVSVVFSYKSGDTYIPTVIGLDYKYLLTHKIYKQTLFRLLERGVTLGCKKLQMGFGASMEKRKLNCKPVETFSFVHMVDSYNAEYITNYKSSVS